VSRYEWERGTLQIPRDQWPKFRSTIIEAYNAHRMNHLRTAERLHAWVKTNRLRGESYSSAVNRGIDALRVSQEDSWEIERLILKRPKERGETDRLRKPTKRALGLLAITKSANIYLGEASIQLQNSSREVTWHVPENNHAREHARRHPVAQRLFSALRRIRWTRGSGGVITGNDEFNRDCDYDGGGANYVVAEYGPKAKRPASSWRRW